MLTHQQIIRKFAEYLDAEVPETLDSNQEIIGQLLEIRNDFCSQASLHVGYPQSFGHQDSGKKYLFWAPTGWPTGRIKHIASSRLGSKLFDQPCFGQALRTSILSADSDNIFVTGQKTTLAKPVARACKLFAVGNLQFRPLPKKLDGDWIHSSIELLGTDSNENLATVIYYSGETSDADEICFSVANEVRVLHQRKGGQIDRLVERFGNESGPTIIRLVQPEDRVPPSIDNPHVSDWFLCSGDGTTKIQPMDSAQGGTITIDQVPAGFLSHWTRGTRQPWPDESPQNQWDRLLLTDSAANGPLATLCRILSQRRILSSGHIITRKQRVVCFTEVPLADFPNRKIFRHHLARWDFERYGIAIARSAIERLGGRQVEYVDDTVGNADADPFKVACRPDSPIDWRSEQEWRIPGDVDLCKLTSSEAVVFVGDQSDVPIVAALSKWPIVVLPPMPKPQKPTIASETTD